MKKNLLTIAAVLTALVFANNEAKAQNSVLKTVAVNVELKDVTAVGPEGPSGAANVDFLYATASDYNNDKSVTIPNQFNVTSTKAYDILLRADKNFEGQTTSSQTLPLDILKVSARTSGTGTFGASKIPTLTNEVFVENAAAALNQSFDVLYTIEKNETLLVAPKQKYTTNLIYSVTVH